MDAAATESASRYVVFSVSGRLLALPAAAVRRFLPLPRLDTPPTAPPVVAGCFRYQGRIVPVLRLDLLLGLEPAAPGLYAPLLLIERDGRPLALLADRVSDVIPAVMQELPDTGLTFNGCAIGSVRFRANDATVLAPERLLTETEGHLLAAFQAMADERLAKWQAAEGAEPAA
ncbi:chemotaxis protein CheW [Azospirillum soli]|uniref:chemotaxis protein CheW n=1 Tax=Azospirillum soli TaxID=1304799 RepID=UPI001AE1C2C2|nr:chemotaxis protein CheW [Azospirillum soli]MBP2313140.1 purine-binding chemotaxis protein CheW [Azospirillum soli]